MKKIVVISPQFFDIEKYIVEELESRFHRVYWFDERINSKKTNKIILRKVPFLKKMQIDKYYKKIFNFILENRIDIVFFIKSEATPLWFFQALSKYSDIKKIHYMYDPLLNYPEIIAKIKYCDRSLTFDENDAKKYGMIHRPLFFPKYLEEIRDKNIELKYNMCFIGTLHSDRAQVIQEIKNSGYICWEKVYIYYYIPLRLIYVIEKIRGNKFKNLKWHDVHKEPLSKEKTWYSMLESKIVLDIHHDNQTGLTNRMLEALGLRKKIITTNPHVKNYDFYHPNNILVIDKNNIKIDSDWLKTPYFEIEENIEDQYTIESFVDDILGTEGDKNEKI